MTKHQDRRKETPHHKQPLTQQQALKQTQLPQQSRAWHSKIFAEEAKDFRGETPQPAPATSKSAFSLQVTGLEGEWQS